MKKRNFLLFFFLPLVGITIILFVFSSINRSYVKTSVEGLVKEQLQATAEILKVNISHYLKESATPEEIFELYSGEDNIYFMALLNEQKEILGWRSRFEGYLPLSLDTVKEKGSWIIDSPAGKIFNTFSSFSLDDKNTYHLYLGYSMENLVQMLSHSRRSFYIIFGFIFLVGIIFFLGLYKLQSQYLAKKKEVEDEKKEKEKYREISAFTSGVAHEIKNPLNSLSLLFELLQKNLEGELQDKVILGKKEVQKISRIIDQFNASLKPLKLNKEEILLKELIADILKSLKSYIGEKGINVQYFEDNPVILNADRELLSQAFTNLLKNSIEATDQGDIIIKVRKGKNKVIINIKDSGRGIAEQDQARIFDPFFSRKANGMGIGLYLTKKIIETHEARIDLTSNKRHGTTFTIQLPGGYDA